MADHTAIEWTDATWNPLRGCSRVSTGCRHCYAEGVAARFSGPGLPYEGLIHPTTRGWNGQVRLVPELLRQPWDWVKPRRIFVNSMSDLFHEAVPFEFIAAVFWVMSVTTRHTYQVLTKRPARMLEFFRWLLAHQEADEYQPNDPKAAYWLANAITEIGGEHPDICALPWEPASTRRGGYDNCGPNWPFENVWIGVSVEDQAAADYRIPLLLQCPAAVRWLSCEPLLGPVSLRWTPYAHEAAGQSYRAYLNQHGQINEYEALRKLDWVVLGGESGCGARPMHPGWARTLRDQCGAAGVPFFFKQWGEWQIASDANRHCGSVMPDTGERYTWLSVDGRTSNPSALGLEDAYAMARVGKKRAGRALDDMYHDEYPAEERVQQKEIAHGRS